MKWREAERVGDIIKQLLKAENLERPMNEQRLLNIYPEIVGAMVNRYTLKRYIIKGVLYIHLSSAPLRSEMTMHRTRLIKALNEAVGDEVITDIVFK